MASKVSYPIYEQIKNSGVTNSEAENKNFFHLDKDQYGEVSIRAESDKDVLNITMDRGSMRQASPISNSVMPRTRNMAKRSNQFSSNKN